MPVTRARNKSLHPEANDSDDMNHPRRVTRSYAHIKPINEVEIEENEHHHKSSKKRNSASGTFIITDEVSNQIVCESVFASENSNFAEPPKKRGRKSKRPKCSSVTAVNENKLQDHSSSIVEPDSTVTFSDLKTIVINDQISACDDPKIVKVNESLVESRSSLIKNDCVIYNKTPMKRESTYIIEKEPHPGNENMVDSSTKNKSTTSKHIFGAASPTKTFRDSSNKKKNVFQTPPKTFCRFLSVGSAGQTPIPPKDKFKNIPECLRAVPNSTPKRKSPFLNLTRSIEKSENEPKSELFPTNLTRSIEKPENKQKNTLFPTNLTTQTNKSTVFPSFSFPNVFNGKKVEFKNKSKLPISKLQNKPLMKNRTVVDDKKKSRGISKATKKPTIAFSNAKAQQILKVIQTNGVPTPKQIVKPVVPLSRKNMPNFHSVHQKQFEKMESLLQNKLRKEERAKKLMSYTPHSKDTTTKFTNENRPNTASFTKFGFKLNLDGYKILPKVNYEDSPNTKTTIKSKVKEQMNSSPTINRSVNKTSTENREFLLGVRTNRRFELQMKARNAK